MKDEIKEITLKDLLPNEFYINKNKQMVAEITIEKLNIIADILTNLQEEKKIPEKIKIDNEDRIQALSTGNFAYKVNQPTKNIIYKINEIIDYLKSKGE